MQNVSTLELMQLHFTSTNIIVATNILPIVRFI